MSDSILSPALSGINLYPSSAVPEGQMIRTPDGIYFHSRISVRGKKRRPHGRTNGPRRWKVTIVRYQPEYDRLLRASRSSTQEGNDG